MNKKVTNNVHRAEECEFFAQHFSQEILVSCFFSDSGLLLRVCGLDPARQKALTVDVAQPRSAPEVILHMTLFEASALPSNFCDATRCERSRRKGRRLTIDVEKTPHLITGAAAASGSSTASAWGESRCDAVDATVAIPSWWNVYSWWDARSPVTDNLVRNNVSNSWPSIAPRY